MRPVTLTTYDDGVDAWTMANAAADIRLAGLVRGYTDYSERTGSFQTRREMPSLKPVLIINTGAPVMLTGGDGAAVRLRAGEGFLAGLHETHAVSSSQGTQSGIHVWLTMAGFCRMLGRASGEAANTIIRLDDVFGQDAVSLGHIVGQAREREARFAALDRVLGGWVGQTEALRGEVAWAFDRLCADPSARVGDLAADIGWSRRVFSDHFRARYGVGPKTVGRLARFERVVASVAQARRPDWAALAADAGYFDQSHMIRDFAAFAGLSPSDYHARMLPAAGGWWSAEGRPNVGSGADLPFVQSRVAVRGQDRPRIQKDNPMTIRPSIIPCLSYDDAPAAIDFLCRAFGFEKRLVAPGERPGEIAHAQLTYRGDMIMLSTATKGSRERFSIVSPVATSGLVTGCICIGVVDPDAHYAVAAAAGAVTLATPHDNSYGGRGYEVRDPEGYVWSFSSYDPWA